MVLTELADNMGVSSIEALTLDFVGSDEIFTWWFGSLYRLPSGAVFCTIERQCTVGVFSKRKLAVTACELISLLDLDFQIKSKSTNELIGISFDFRAKI